MSDTIQGAKSRDYQRENVPGIENSQDTLEYQTVQEISGKRGAADVVIHGTTLVSSAHTVDAGSVRRKIVSNAHGAKKGWIMRPSSGNSQGEEIAIVQVSDDGNSFVISTFFDIAIGDTFDLLKSVTPNYTASGDLNVIAVPGPVVFSLDGVDTEVAEDTVTPANNTPLPSKMFIEIDGVIYPVRKDTGTPANTVSVPVEITGASGPINITAGDINVQLTDLGANFDRTRIGDGTNQLGINASSEALVHDADVLSELQNIALIDFATETTLGSINSAVAGISVQLPPVIGPLLSSVSLSITPASDAVFNTKPKAITGSFDEKLAFSTAQTFVAPANAISANIMNVGADNVRFKQGAVAGGASGLRLEPRRSEMVMNGSNISVIPETGFAAPCDVAIIWNIQP